MTVMAVMIMVMVEVVEGVDVEEVIAIQGDYSNPNDLGLTLLHPPKL